MIESKHRLKEDKESLQIIFDEIGDGISVIDREYRIKRVNAGIFELFKKKNLSELIGSRCFAAYQRREEVCENCPADLTFKEGKPHRITKIWRMPDKKARVIFDISTFPVKDEAGNIVQIIEYFKDVSETVKLEDQLLYQERLAGVGELAAGIAHEIRNPLGNISASAQFCLNKYKLNQQMRRHLKVILRNAEHANRIVKDLLDFARPSEIAFKVGHIENVIESVCNLVKTRCSKQRVRLTRRLGRWLPPIPLDKKQIGEAFLNLVLNALDAMPDGGRLTIMAYPDPQNREIVISFLDTGRGIPQEDLDRIFNPFFTTKKDGIGLGLSLVLQVISCHRGRIDIESEDGRGTEATVRLPTSRE